MKLPDPDKYLPLIKLAMNEDLGSGDITSQVTIPADKSGSGALVFQQDGIICGMPVVREICRCYDEKLYLSEYLGDSQSVSAGTTVGEVIGPLRSVLAAERVILNFLQHLTAIATTTARYVAAVKGTKAKIFDTRKTTPGWRELEKYAVRCGGGFNHRLGLYDAALIKDNHLAGLSDYDLYNAISEAVEKFHSLKPPPEFIEVEVDTLDQLQSVLRIEDVNMILLDNMNVSELSQAVKIRDNLAQPGRILLEASGGINLTNVLQIAQSGVDRISIGALTHSIKNLDISMDLL